SGMKLATSDGSTFSELICERPFVADAATTGARLRNQRHVGGRGEKHEELLRIGTRFRPRLGHVQGDAPGEPECADPQNEEYAERQGRGGETLQHKTQGNVDDLCGDR